MRRDAPLPADHRVNSERPLLSLGTRLELLGVLLAFAGTFATLAFWWSASTSLACGGLWLILATQRR